MRIPQFDIYVKAIKKYMFDILGEKYNSEIDETIERIGNSMATKRDAENVIRLLGAVYLAGYQKAVESTQQVAADHGFKFKVVMPKASDS